MHLCIHICICADESMGVQTVVMGGFREVLYKHSATEKLFTEN